MIAILALLHSLQAAPFQHADVTVADLLAELSRETGHRYAASPEIADERLVVYARPDSAARLPGMLARLLDCSWEDAGGTRLLVSRRDWVWDYDASLAKAEESFRSVLAQAKAMPAPTGDFEADQKKSILREPRRDPKLPYNTLTQPWQVAFAQSTSEEALERLLRGDTIVAATHWTPRDVTLPGDASWYSDADEPVPFAVVLSYSEGSLRSLRMYGEAGSNSQSHSIQVGPHPFSHDASPFPFRKPEPAWNHDSDPGARSFREPTVEAGETLAQALRKIAQEEPLSCLALSNPFPVRFKGPIHDYFQQEGFLLVRGRYFHRARDLWQAKANFAARESWPVLRDPQQILDREVRHPVSRAIPEAANLAVQDSSIYADPRSLVFRLWNAVGPSDRQRLLESGIPFADLPEQARFAVRGAFVRQFEYEGTLHSLRALSALGQAGCRITLECSVTERIHYSLTRNSGGSSGWPPSQSLVQEHPEAPASRLVTLAATVTASNIEAPHASPELWLSQVVASGTVRSLAQDARDPILHPEFPVGDR
ncbi:MAG: hypothetical protein IT207_07335 [Fimbriimonadaceae bacterium]|nr:hypothetical protein [Fimbriimonadaceae bacterium]